MSLTSEIREGTQTYHTLTSVINYEQLINAVQKLNTICASRRLLRPLVITESYPFKLVGKAMTYALLGLTQGHLYGSYIYKHSASDPKICDFIESQSVFALKLLAAAMYEDQLRSGYSVHDRPKLPGQLGLPGRITNENLAVVEDISQLVAGLQSTSVGLMGTNIRMNVPPYRSMDVGGADIQMTVDSDMWFSYTTTKRSPVTVPKLEQAICYYLLDLREDLESASDWDHIVLHFPRHQQVLRLPAKQFLLPEDHPQWAIWKNYFFRKKLGQGNQLNGFDWDEIEEIFKEDHPDMMDIYRRHGRRSDFI